MFFRKRCPSRFNQRKIVSGNFIKGFFVDIGTLPDLKKFIKLIPNLKK